MDTVALLIVALVGLIAGFINVIVGSGSSITIPILVFLGLPPHIAIGTNRFAMLFNNGTGAIRYYQKKYLDLKVAFIFSAFAAVGAAVGAFLVLETRPDILVKIIAFILIAEAVVVLLGRKRLGIENKEFESTRKNLVIGAVAGLLIGLYGGFIGMAMTSMFIFVFVSLFGLSFLRSAAMAKVLTFVISLVATAIFLASLKVDLLVGGVLAVAYIVGAYFGVNSAIKMGDPKIKIFFIIIVIASAVKLLFF